jgi:Ca-activated chloride channel family protein
MRATLFSIAKDVKIQIEFNPSNVKAYRFVGYENRIMAREDFSNDMKDAGELWAGHSVTALYEIVPAVHGAETFPRDELKYQESSVKQDAVTNHEIITVKLRYKRPEERASRLLELVVSEKDRTLREKSNDFIFSAAVAGFGMLLRDSEFKGDLTYEKVLSMARAGRGRDENGYRTEFINLVKSCDLLQG